MPKHDAKTTRKWINISVYCPLFEKHVLKTYELTIRLWQLLEEVQNTVAEFPTFVFYVQNKCEMSKWIQERRKHNVHFQNKTLKFDV